MAVTQSRKFREGSALTEIYTEEDRGGPYVIHFDEWLTRRKRFHIITDLANRVLFRSRWVSDLFDWLDERGAREYTALAGKRAYVVTLEPVSTEKGQSK